ncbi:MAG: hypothetical protein AB9835_06475 [Eubacteriales bacterium]
MVYCAEGVDNGGQLYELKLDITAPVKTVRDEALDVTALEVKASRRKSFESLYRPVRQDTEEVAVKLVPYYTFANRGQSEMAVWLRS